MNKNINTVVELNEKELECVTGGGLMGGLIGMRFEVECPKSGSALVLSGNQLMTTGEKEAVSGKLGAVLLAWARSADGKMIFWDVMKPSAAAGFFTIGVSATKGK